MDLIDRYPGSATLKFLKSFERFIDIPRTEKERLEAWGIYSTDADVNDTVNEKERVRETEKTKSGDGDLEISVTSPESLSGKYSTGSETMSQSGIKHPSVSSLSQAPTTANKQISATVASQVAATVNRPPDSPRHSIMSPPKKSRLGALLARTSSGMGSRPVSTNIMSSPRHKAAVAAAAAAAAALKEEIQAPAPVPLSRQIMIAATCRGRSSSFNDAPDSVIVIAETPILSKTLSLTLPDHSLTSPAVSAENSPVATSRKTSKSPRNHCADLSEDNRFRDTGDSVVHNSLAHAHAHASTHTSSTSTSTSSHSVATIAPTSASVPPQALSSSGWKIPSDITWPTAYDKGSLPPSDYRNERMKLIPSITLGPWVVKAAVGATPVLLGRKVVQRYFRGEDYMEIDIHIGSSVIAAQVCSHNCHNYHCNYNNVVISIFINFLTTTRPCSFYSFVRYKDYFLKFISYL